MASEFTILDSLQALHRDVLALQEGRADNAGPLWIEDIRGVFRDEINKIWKKPERRTTDLDAVRSAKIEIDGEEYTVNGEFKDIILALADETEFNEIEVARILLNAQDDASLINRPLLQRGLIRFHQQRKFALDTLRLLLELDRLSEEEKSDTLDDIKAFVEQELLIASAGSTRRPAEQCIDAMAYTKMLLKKVGDKLTAASMLGQDRLGQLSDEMETMEFVRVSLYQQHEVLGLILSRIFEKGLANQQDFMNLLDLLRRADKYDALLIHVIPAFAAFVTSSTLDGDWTKMRPAMEINNLLSPRIDTLAWALPSVQAGLRSWWLVEFSGFFVEEPPEGIVDSPINIDEEDKQKTKDFIDSLKDGAFDFLLALVADVKSQEWQDPARTGMRQWLQRKTPGLSPEWTQFSSSFQTCLVQHLEAFVDAFISNLPDVLRKLRVEEDEQRQLSQNHEHDLDLERFLIVIAYTYEGRPDAAMSFWSDPDSNLAGFMHWASRRASTPLVTAFCEMLQSIAEDTTCANAAHEFLLDEGHHASGKMRRSQSLTWHQIFRELVFFSSKIREKPSPTQTIHRPGKPNTDQAEAEPESAMMLECYLRLITKLAVSSENTRQYLLRDASPSVLDILFQLAGSQIPARLRACVFVAIRALLTRKTVDEGYTMWQCLDSWMTGGYTTIAAGHHRTTQYQPLNSMERIFDEMGRGFEEPYAFVQLLTALVLPAEDDSPLNDSLPFPENLGSTFRQAGIEQYIDFVMGHVFGLKSNEITDIHQLRMLRLACLDFAMTCLDTFNEELIVLANSTNIMVDNAIATTDLATYVRLHPFSRVIEWMFHDKVMTSLFNTIHQKSDDVSNATPDSPVIQGILRGVQVISKVLELQATYLDLVRPAIKMQANQRRTPVANAAFSSFDDGLVTRLSLVVDLGIYCGLGHADLTLACLKLLEKMSGSPRISSAWSSGHNRNRGRNKAIVALEADGEHEPIAGSLIADLREPLQPGGERDSPGYLIKIYILEFLYACLRQSPRRPSIAHLLLGFKCGTDILAIEPEGAFDTQKSLFHALLRLLIETPSRDEFGGMRQWMVALRSKAISILQILWTSPLSSGLVLEELRVNEFVFHLLLTEVVIQPDLPWEGESVNEFHFPMTTGATTLVDFITLRAWAMDYIAMELCSITQNRLPALKRRIFEALNGQVSVEGNEHITVPTIFDLYDFLLPADAWQLPPPPLSFYEDVEIESCKEADRQGRPVYNVERVKDILLLKQAENRLTGRRPLATAQDLAQAEREESMIIDYLAGTNHQSQIMSESLNVLKTWAKLVLVMIECNDFKGTARTSFFLQCLQAILPSLELYASDRPAEAFELARLARILLFKLDLSTPMSMDGESEAVGNLVSDRLYQLFQICLTAIGKWAGDAELRAVYYSICFRYISGMADPTGPLVGSRHKTANAIHIYGERLLGVICDDACGSEVTCQTAALILLNALVNMGAQENDNHVIETMNRLNFIGVVVDSLRNLLEEWIQVIEIGNMDQQHYHSAKLALLLQLAQTREGAKHVVNANLFRSLQLAGLFAADPELQANAQKSRALEQLYGLLVKVARIVSAAIVSRGSHNLTQGLKFLRDYRSLVSHTLKRSAGIGPAMEGPLGEKIEELADAFMVLITATGFLESEEQEITELQQRPALFFH